MWSWTACFSWPCFEQAGWTRQSPEVTPTSAIPWFYWMQDSGYPILMLGIGGMWLGPQQIFYPLSHLIWFLTKVWIQRAPALSPKGAVKKTQTNIYRLQPWKSRCPPEISFSIHPWDGSDQKSRGNTNPKTCRSSNARTLPSPFFARSGQKKTAQKKDETWFTGPS